MERVRSVCFVVPRDVPNDCSLHFSQEDYSRVYEAGTLSALCFVIFLSEY